jgi:hypothetical protein
MPYVQSSLISRTGYSGMGADPSPCKCGGGCGHATQAMGDIELTPTVLAVGAVAAWFLFFRKKR